MKTKLLFIFLLGFFQNSFAQSNANTLDNGNKVAIKNQVNFLKASNMTSSHSMTHPTIKLKAPEMKSYVYDIYGNESVKKQKKHVPKVLRPKFKFKKKAKNFKVY